MYLINVSTQLTYTWWKDYRIYVLLFSLLKLYNLDIPVLDEHNWRQCLTLGVARNFIEIDPNILYPRTPICDSRSGIIPQEFPILNYLIAMFWYVFGQENWVFRLIMIITTSMGLVAFYKFIKEQFNRDIALLSLILFASSIAFAYSRKAMPDMFAISLCLGSLYFGLKYLQNGRILYLLLYVILASLGLLSKMPAAIVMCLLILPILDDKIKSQNKLWLISASLIPLCLLFLWYFKWVPYLEDTYGFKLYYTRSFADGWREIMNLGSRTFERFSPILFQNHIHFFAAAAGLFFMIRMLKWKLIFTILSSIIISVFFIAKTGKVFANHEYYILPLIPFMSLLAAYFYKVLLDRSIYTWLFIGILSLLSLHRQWHHMSIKENLKHYTALEAIVTEHIPEGKKIMINSINGNPMPLYMAHRNGWLNTDKYLDTMWLAGERTVGLDYLLLLKEKLPESTPFTNPLYEDEHFLIYKNNYVK